MSHTRPSPFTYSPAEVFAAEMEGVELPPLLVIEVEIEEISEPGLRLRMLRERVARMLWWMVGR